MSYPERKQVVCLVGLARGKIVRSRMLEDISGHEWKDPSVRRKSCCIL